MAATAQPRGGVDAALRKGLAGQPTQPAVSVPLTIIVQEGADSQKDHALYDITLNLGDTYAWTVSRRFSEFDALRKVRAGEGRMERSCLHAV
jgi:hypothetical protein